MSGWDTPSRPTWDPQDGPEDSTQAFPAPDGSGADDRWSQPVGPGSGWSGSGPADNQDFGRPDFGLSEFGDVNPSGADLGGSDVSRDLGRADRRPPAFPPEPNGFPADRNGFPPDRNAFPPDRNGFPPDRNGFPPEPNAFPSDRNAFPPDRNGFPPEPNAFPPDRNGFPPEPNGFPPDQNGFPRGGASSPPPSDFFTQAFDERQPGTQAFEQRQPGATLAGRQLPGTGRYVSGPQVSARDEPPWPGPDRSQSARQESARPEYGRAGEYGRADENGRAGEYGRQDSGRADFDRPGAPGGPSGPSGPGAAPGQELSRRDPGRADFSAYSTYSGQPDQAEQAPPANRSDAELAARMDPALQDFFAPTKPDPRYTSGRPSQAAQSQGLPAPGQPGPDRSDQAQQPPRRGDGRGPRRPGRVPDPWEDPDGGQDGPQRPGQRGGRRDEIEPAGRGKVTLAILAVVVVAAAVVAYLAVHRSSTNNNNATGGATPTTSTSASAPTASAKPTTTSAAKNPDVTGSAASAGSYVLSAPSTAAGFPIGTDPKFLATATSTAATIEQSGISGGGGTVTGSPVSASYTLPDEQTIEFVGYQGTFNPSKVMSNLASYGSSEKTYPAGPNGGDLACANTTATASTPSGAVCVWVTKSTLGFTEFFTQADGPEALNTAQAKGAEDAVNLRASVEKLKS
jgi:hypothetical protein